MKQQNNLKTPTQMDRFNRALSGLSQVETPFQDESQSSLTPSVQTKTDNQPQEASFRESIMDSVIAKNPGLTREKLSKQMEEMGF